MTHQARSFANETIYNTGAGESGKSTILKQMRLIYTKDGFTKNEKEEWRVIIFNNILDGLRMTVAAMEEYGIEFENEKTKVRLASSLLLATRSLLIS